MTRRAVLTSDDEIRVITLSRNDLRAGSIS